MFILVVKQKAMMHIVSVEAIVGLAHWVRENAASDRINTIWLVNNHPDVNTHWIVHEVTMPESRCDGGR
jgi:hypothetical protein